MAGAPMDGASNRTAAIRGGTATSIGSLPHTDARAAAAFVLRTHPDLPAAPQLPNRSPLEGMLAQWLRALPEVHVEPDGSLRRIDVADLDAPLDTTFDSLAHGGLVGFLEVSARLAQPPKIVKLQVTGPLTLGLALCDLGLPTDVAFARASTCARAWARAVVTRARTRVEGVDVLLFFDEPGLVAFHGDDAPIDPESATDILSGALAAVDCTVGVHVCGAGSLPVALAAGPDVLGIEVHPRALDHAAGLARFLDEGSFVAWGAVPTDRPIGEQVTAPWKAVLDLWCELARRGCDPLRLRQQALVSPACGLARHGVTQAERALRLARELAHRVGDQAAATRLSVGA
jgi:hypothetical protein